MPALAGLKRFAASRKGKVAIGGTAVGGAVVAGLVARKRAGGDPSAAPAEEITAPPFGIAPGSPSGAGFGFDEIGSPTVDMGQFEQLLADLGRAADALDDLNSRQEEQLDTGKLRAPTMPRPGGGRTLTAQKGTPPVYVVKPGDTWTDIARAFYGTAIGTTQELLQRNRAAHAPGATRGAQLNVGKAIYLPHEVAGKRRLIGPS